MGRVNKTIEGVFIDIVGSPSEVSGYDQFLNHGNDVEYTKELKEMTELYKSMVIKNKDAFEQLATLEEIIMQMRIRENLEDIKLSQVREYIYARTPFYRKDKKSKDVRVIVNKVEFYPESDGNLEILFGDVAFMEKAKYKLVQAMDSEIAENIRTFKSTFRK